MAELRACVALRYNFGGQGAPAVPGAAVAFALGSGTTTLLLVVLVLVLVLSPARSREDCGTTHSHCCIADGTFLVLRAGKQQEQHGHSLRIIAVSLDFRPRCATINSAPEQRVSARRQ